MSGPRVTSGDDSMQDAATPPDFMAAVGQRFGEVVFDLAAHRLNKKHPRYFAPAELVEKIDPAKNPNGDAIVMRLVDRGARKYEAERAVDAALALDKKSLIRVPNHDPEAYGYDALKQDWHVLSKTLGRDGKPGLLWDNCEWADVTPWAEYSAKQAALGANTTLLTPAVITNWFRDIIAGRADVYLNSGRQCFDGRNVFPKDTMVSHFWPGATGRMCVWDWKRDVVTTEWRLR